MNQPPDIDQISLHAVITGDLVKSSAMGLDATDAAMAVLARAAREMKGWPIGPLTALGDLKFTRHRGDGWQVHLEAGAFGLRAAVTLFSRLAAFPDLPQTRLALGLGAVERVPGRDLSEAHGAAFEISGRALADMQRGERFVMRGAGVSPVIAAFSELLHDRMRDWSQQQAEAVSRVIEIDFPYQTEVAATLGITPQALSARLKGAGWSSLSRVLGAWERSFPQAVEDA
ncbi:MAG: hypothetical protein OIF48_16680 [Silicimonas sp.]|nr:hypothetical protein [Silicimonas sp.]